MPTPNRPQDSKLPADQKHPGQPQQPNQQHKPTDQQHKVDPKTGASKDDPSGIDPNYNTKPQDQGGGDQSAHPSPITDPTNMPPEPAQWSDDNPRPPLAQPGDPVGGYVAGQPINQEEYELTEKEAAERVRPEAWERLKGQGVEVDEGQKDASVGWSRDKEGTRPDGRPLRSPATKDDDVNKAPGGAGGQGTRADGRARAPEGSSPR